MKKTLYALLFCFLLFKIENVFAQSWDKTYDFADYQYSSKVIQDNDSGYVILGDCSIFDGNICLFKTDLDGNLIWSKTYGDPIDNEFSASVKKTFDGGYIIAGYTNHVAFYNDVFLIKTDNNGDTVWAKTYPKDYQEQSAGILQTSDSGYIILAHSFSISPWINYDYLIKTDKMGDTLWTKILGESCCGGSIVETVDGGYIIGVTSNDVGNYFKLIKTNDLGDTLWTKTFGINGSYLSSLTQTNDGGYALIGSANQDVYFVKTDSLGNLIWTKSFGGMSADNGKSLEQTRDGGYIIVGSTSSFGSGYTNIYLIKTDSNGNPMWAKNFGGNIQTSGNSVLQTFDGGYVVAGEKDDAQGSSTSSFYLMKIDSSSAFPPIISFSADTIKDCVPPHQVTFSVNASVYGYNNGDTLTTRLYFGDGSDTIYYSLIDSAYFSKTDSIEHTYEVSGNYSIQFIATSPNDLSDTVTKYNYITVLDSCPPSPPLPNNDCCIKGRVYHDLNGNCSYDTLEPFQQKWLVQLFKDSIFYLMDKPDASGWYYFYFPCDSNPQNYVVRIDPFYYWWEWDATCPASQTYFVNPIKDSCLILDFGVDTIATTSGQDLAVATDVVGWSSPGSSERIIDGVCNKGNVTESGTLILVHDANYTYNSSSPTPDAISGDTLKWNFTNLAPGQCFVTTSYFTISTSTFNGFPLWYKGIAEPIVGDLTPYNNMDTSVLIVGAPYDPNNKLSSPGGVSGKILPSTQELNYTINFQNTGNAPAYNIVLLDTLPVNEIDLGTIRFGASSFPYTLDFFGNGVVKITFTNIMLPDSNVDEAGSHGFVQYTAKLKSNLPIGTQIKNRAGIYFDFNEVVMTEYAVNTIDTTLTGIKEVKIEKEIIHISPNPFSNNTNISYSLDKNARVSLEVFNLIGEKVKTMFNNSNQSKGFYQFKFNGEELKLIDGLYLIKLTIDGKVSSKKVLMVQ